MGISSSLLIRCCGWADRLHFRLGAEDGKIVSSSGYLPRIGRPSPDEELVLVILKGKVSSDSVGAIKVNIKDIAVQFHYQRLKLKYLNTPLIN